MSSPDVSLTKGIWSIHVIKEGEAFSYLKSITYGSIKYLDSKFIKDMYYSEISQNIIFEEQDVTFVAMTDGGLSGNGYIHTPSIDIDGSKECIVVWDGVEYKCTPIVDSDTEESREIYVGNTSFVGENGEDTGEPFLILDSLEMTVFASVDEGTHKVCVYQGSKNVKQVPAECVDGYTTDEIDEMFANIDLSNYATKEDVAQADWNETNTESPAYIKNKPAISADGTVVAQSDWAINDESSAAFIKNKPFGDTTESVELVPLQDITLTYNEDNGGWDEFILEGTLPYSINVGSSYTVTYGDNTYNTTAFNYMGAPCLGNALLFGGNDTGEPFVIGYDESGTITGNIGLSIMSTEDAPTDGTTSKTIHFQIIGDVTTIKYIDPKYIKDMYYEGIKSNTLVASQEFAFSLDSSYSSYGIYSVYPVSTSQITYFSLTNGDKYTVIWDGTEYTCTAVDLTLGIMNGYALGNASLFGLGDDTGEPFLIADIPTASSIAFMTTDASASHTVEISDNDSYINQIDNKYLSILESTDATVIVPEQTVSSMRVDDGVYMYPVNTNVNISSLVGQTVYVTYNGTVYELPVTDDGAIGDTSLVDTPFCIVYQGLPTAAILSNATGEEVTVKVLDKPSEYSVKSEYLAGVSIDAKSALPEVTEEDNGKFLRVVDGAWAIVDIGIAEEGAF